MLGRGYLGAMATLRDAAALGDGTPARASLAGGADFDLREARWAGAECVLTVNAFMGGATIVVGPDVDVVMEGIGIMGGFDDNATGPGSPGAPVIIIDGFAFWGGVDVKRRPTKAEAERRRLERKQLKAEEKAARRQLED